MLNLVSAANASSKEDAVGLYRPLCARHQPGKANPSSTGSPDYAIRYYEDFVKPAKSYRAPSEGRAGRARRVSWRALRRCHRMKRDAELIQTEVYSAGKDAGFEQLRDWFQALYEVLLGQSQGPRFGGFAAIYGLPRTIHLIRRALDGEDLANG